MVSLMKAQRTVCLKLWLPLLVMVLFTLQIGFMMIFQSRMSEQGLEQKSLQSVQQMVEHLKEEKLLTAAQFEEAEHELALLDSERAVQVMAVVDAMGNVLLATDAGWVGKSAMLIEPYFISDHFQRALTRQHPVITLADDGSTIIVFAPIMRTEKQRLRESAHPGAFFLLYDLSVAKASIWSDVVTESLVLWLVSLLAMSVLVAVLHVLVNRPVQHLVESANRMASGEEGIQVHLVGGGELAGLGQAFNDMSSRCQDILTILRRSEEQNRLLLESAGEGIIAIDREGRATIANPAAAAMLKFTEDELIGQLVHNLIHHSYPDGTHYPAAECRMKRAIREGTKQYISDEVLWCKDGTSIPVEYTSAPIRKDGEIQGMVIIFKDITRRREAEEALRLAATAFETQEAILIADYKANIVRVNRAFSEITGYSPQEVIGKTPKILQSNRQDKDFYRRMWGALLETGSWQGEIWNRRKNGEIYPEWLSTTAVRNDAGEITHYVATFSDISRRKQAEEELEYLAYYDPLTGLINRHLLNDRIGQLKMGREHSGYFAAALFIDLDHFKNINDSLGHTIGDALLKEMATRLTEALREEDSVARLGGDEFLILLPQISRDSEAAVNRTSMVAEKILETTSRSCVIDEHELHVSASIGITLFRGGEITIDDILKRADMAMYRAKEEGRNTYKFFLESMQLQAEKRLEMENELRHALTEGELMLHFQPQMDVLHNVIGAECLVRWIHPERGMVSPGEFIPVAEESGLILPIGEWVLRTACLQLKYLLDCGLNPTFRHLAVNVSPKQFHQESFVSQVESILAETSVNPTYLQLELTEGILISDVEDTIGKMQALKKIGISFSIDDFGTGYSSLAYLQRLPLDQLKIDQSFIRGITTDKSAAAIVDTTISMAKNLELDVIAEGVETKKEMKLLEKMGCRSYQGYYFSRPLIADLFEEFVCGKISL